MSAFTTVIVRISKTKTKRLTVGKKSARNLIYLFSSWIFLESKTDVSFGFEADVVVALGLNEEINLLAAKFLLDVRDVVCFYFPASTTCVYIWHFRWTKCLATVGSAIVCDRLLLYGNSSLRDSLRMETSLKKHQCEFFFVSAWRSWATHSIFVCSRPTRSVESNRSYYNIFLGERKTCDLTRVIELNAKCQTLNWFFSQQQFLSITFSMRKTCLFIGILRDEKTETANSTSPTSGIKHDRK